MAVDAAFVAMDAGQVDMIANQMRRNPTREAKILLHKWRLTTTLHVN